MSDPCKMEGSTLVVDQNDVSNLLWEMRQGCQENIRRIGVEYQCKRKQVFDYSTNRPKEVHCEHFRVNEYDGIEYCECGFFKKILRKAPEPTEGRLGAIIGSLRRVTLF